MCNLLFFVFSSVGVHEVTYFSFGFLGHYSVDIPPFAARPSNVGVILVSNGLKEGLLNVYNIIYYSFLLKIEYAEMWWTFLVINGSSNN